MLDAHGTAPFPLPLSSYPSLPGESLAAVLRARIEVDPLNAVATGIFLLAVLHTFFAARFTAAAQALQDRQDARAVAEGRTPRPSVAAELLRFFGEVEVIFGLWVIPLGLVIATSRGWDTVTHYLNDTVSYTEALFVVVIMALASTRPVIDLAERALRRLATRGGGSPAAWWLTILIVAPLLGSLITEPAAMTIAALLLGRQFYDLQPPPPLKYATLGLLFVNVSIGGTLTHFASPPMLMVARPWGWTTWFVLGQFGWHAVTAVIVSTVLYYAWFRRDLRALGAQAGTAVAVPTERVTAGRLPIPWWITAIYVGFMVWTVVNVHHPALFLGGFLFFLGFDRATAAYSTLEDFRTPLLVGFFLAGLVIHGRLQAWWIAPVLSRLGELPLFAASCVLTSFNDNALITYLATLAPHLDQSLKLAVVQGAVTGGGLTVIANAPNPAGQALLARYFDEAVEPAKLFAGAVVPTLIAAAAFLL
jgi:hypothetical protein